MTEFQKIKLTHLFSLLDINKNGYLQLNDFSDISERLVKKAGIEDNTKEHRFVVEKCVNLFYELLKDIPQQKTRELLLSDWLDFFRREIIGAKDEELLERYVELFFSFTFQMFDKNNDGYISKDEYAQIFEIYGIDTDRITKSFDAMDHYKDGKLSRYELKHAIETFFISNDPRESGNYIFGYFMKSPN